MAKIHHRRRRARAGMTLMEMILVLALMVIIASFTAPALRRPMENQRLRKAGDTIRIAFTRARIRAMRSGQTHAFRYQIGGSGYIVELWRADDAYLESGTDVDVNQTAPLVGSTAAPATQAQAANDEVSLFGQGVPEELPDGAVFLGGLIEADMRGALLEEQMNQLGSAGNLSALNSEWSPPVLFYPDGTTSDAKLVLTNRNQRFVRVSLRGLTGIAQASGFLSRQELELPQ